ncbi:Nn.00g069650.m01.CDS01 [Neocucurbitaria sp. VM-36]
MEGYHYSGRNEPQWSQEEEKNYGESTDPMSRISSPLREYEQQRLNQENRSSNRPVEQSFGTTDSNLAPSYTEGRYEESAITQYNSTNSGGGWQSLQNMPERQRYPSSYGIPQNHYYDYPNRDTSFIDPYNPTVKGHYNNSTNVSYSPAANRQIDDDYSVSCPYRCGAVLTGRHALGNLTRHLKSKTCSGSGLARVRYPCPIEGCDKEYVRSDGLHVHMRRRHGAPPALEGHQDEDEYQNLLVGELGEDYTATYPPHNETDMVGVHAVGNLTRHFGSRAWPGSSSLRVRYTCLIEGCDREYARSDALRVHMRREHVGAPAPSLYQNERKENQSQDMIGEFKNISNMPPDSGSKEIYDHGMLGSVSQHIDVSSFHEKVTSQGQMLVNMQPENSTLEKDSSSQPPVHSIAKNTPNLQSEEHSPLASPQERSQENEQERQLRNLTETQDTRDHSRFVPDDQASSVSYEDSIFSDQSLISAATTMTLNGGYTQSQIAVATWELEKIFVDDVALVTLYNIALRDSDIGPARLQSNLHRLLKLYAKSLQDEAGSELERLTARFVLVKARYLAQCVVEKHYVQSIIRQSKPDRNQDEESSDEEVEPVNEDILLDTHALRGFLINSDAFIALQTQLRMFILPRPPTITARVAQLGNIYSESCGYHHGLFGTFLERGACPDQMAMRKYLLTDMFPMADNDRNVANTYLEMCLNITMVVWQD